MDGKNSRRGTRSNSAKQGAKAQRGGTNKKQKEEVLARIGVERSKGQRRGRYLAAVVALLVLVLSGGALLQWREAQRREAAAMTDGGDRAMLADQKPRLLFEKTNAALGISALFYGTEILGEELLHPNQMITYIVLKDMRTGQAVTYAPESDTRQAADFFFPDIWSPDGAYIVLPLDKRDGFAIFNSETAIQDIKHLKYADTIRVWRGEARRYWHSFDAWEGQAAFYFKGEMEGDSFRFKYDIPARRLSCFDAGCSSVDRAQNIKGDLLAQVPEK
jgi:hypothetical protein